MTAHHPRKSPNSLINLPDILDCLASLEDEEKAITESLHEILSDEERVHGALKQLRSLSPQVDQLGFQARLLSDKLVNTARTADNVAGHVRMLDEEMKRVKEAGAYVAQVMELKTSLVDLRFAIGDKDWEAAARLCARAMSLPIGMMSGRFAESVVPTADSPSPPMQILHEYRIQLRDIFLENFVQATRARDSAMTSRFFKLFPPIGCEQEGLEAYANFVLELVQTKAPLTAKTSSPLYYVTALTALFESVCNILDQHQQVVEKYYGSGKMEAVMARLLKECDETVEKLLEGWEEDREIDRKLAETGASQLDSKSLAALSKQAILFTTDFSKDTDPREIDKVLNEMAAMVMRFTAFRRFLFGNTETDIPDGEKGIIKDGYAALNQRSYSIDSSACKASFDGLLRKFYVPLDTWYLRRTISQAFKSIAMDISQLPPVTNVPDLVFYILKSLLSRLANMGSVLAVENTTKTIRIVMEEEYVGVIRSKLNDVYRTGSGSVSANRSEKTEKEMRLNFILLLNDLDISSSHLERLVKDILNSPVLTQNFLDHELDFVRVQFSNLLSTSALFRSALKSGIDQLFNQLIRPRLRTLILDVYKDVGYNLDEDGYSHAEQQDLVRKRFTKSWDDLLDGCKDTLTLSNYRTLLSQAVDVVLRPWEKYIMTLKYSEDIRSISTYFSSQLSFGDIREKLQRLQQISTLLNIDKDEDVEDFYRSSGISWKLTVAEAYAVASQKL